MPGGGTYIRFAMVCKRDERGEGRVGFLVTLAVFAIGVFVAAKVVPVRINAYQLHDVLRNEARFASANRDADREVKQRILTEAKALEIPLKAEDVRITRTKREVVVHARFDQTVDLKFTTYTYRFDERERAPVF